MTLVGATNARFDDLADFERLYRDEIAPSLHADVDIGTGRDTRPCWNLLCLNPQSVRGFGDCAEERASIGHSEVESGMVHRTALPEQVHEVDECEWEKVQSTEYAASNDSFQCGPAGERTPDNTDEDRDYEENS